jgi:hypothetical protein
MANEAKILFFCADNMNFKVNINPIIWKLVKADFKIFGCIELHLFFISQKYKKTATIERIKQPKGLKI